MPSSNVPTTLLLVRVVPNGSRDEVAGWWDDAVRIRLRAPAVEGKANAALLAFVADRLGLPRSAVTLTSGVRARIKRLAIHGLDRDAVLTKLGLGAC